MANRTTEDNIQKKKQRISSPVQCLTDHRFDHIITMNPGSSSPTETVKGSPSGSSKTQIGEEELIASPEKPHVHIPDGGVAAWLVVAGGFLNFFACFGRFQPATPSQLARPELQLTRA